MGQSPAGGLCQVVGRQYARAMHAGCGRGLRAAFLVSGLVAGASCVKHYPLDLSLWEEVTGSSGEQAGDGAVWRVSLDGQAVSVDQINPGAALQYDPRPRPGFSASRGGTAFTAVDDGWLIAFNKGDLGAALSWFSWDGKQSYLISGDPVVEFFSRSDGHYAVRGNDHGTSWGSVIRIARPEPQGRWTVSGVLDLPQAPWAVSVLRDDTVLVTLSTSLVSLGPSWSLTTLIKKAPWGGLAPNSSVLSADQSHLYIGMRQVVAEVDLTSARLRLLAPSQALRAR